MRVTGFYDMRPIDWVSGKRMPLEAGMGHVCDRCGREHALVYEVTDDETGKVYKVGSGCAMQDFGFDVERDAPAKQLIKDSRHAALLEVDQQRRLMLDEAVQIILTEFDLRVSPPKPEVEVRQPDKPNVVRVGDSVAWVNFRTLEETVKVATWGWYELRVRELIPEGWDKATILDKPKSKSRAATPMATLLFNKVTWVLKHEGART